MALRARLSAPREEQEQWSWHKVKSLVLPISALWGKERRMEAENYISGGYGLRLALENKLGHGATFGAIASVLQPSRLKGIVVGPEFGTPFLAATQVFDARPVPRKFLSLDKVDNISKRLSPEGQILVTRSGSVGKATVAHAAHQGIILSDDLLRVDPLEEKDRGWIYAYLKSPSVRSMLRSAQYGHVIKHLEVSHLAGLPTPAPDADLAERFQLMVQRIHQERSLGHQRYLEAERLFEELIGEPPFARRKEVGFTVQSSALKYGRRRLEGGYHNPSVQSLYAHFEEKSFSVESIQSIGLDCWLPGRFQRIPAEEGIQLVGSADLFEVNPDLPKRIADIDFGDDAQGRVKEGWLLLARSGQIYGLNGTLAIANKFLEDKIISDHVIRMRPRANFNSRVGYIYTALSHPTLGRPLVKALAYGSSIPEIEVGDVNTLQVVRLSKKHEDAIADLAESAAQLYADADLLENEMMMLMEEYLQRLLVK